MTECQTPGTTSQILEEEQQQSEALTHLPRRTSHLEIARDVSYQVSETRASHLEIARDVSYTDSYLLFRNKYLISNVANTSIDPKRLDLFTRTY